MWRVRLATAHCTYWSPDSGDDSVTFHCVRCKITAVEPGMTIDAFGQQPFIIKVDRHTRFNGVTR
jgi:hypothetical protein